MAIGMQGPYTSKEKHQHPEYYLMEIPLFVRFTICTLLFKAAIFEDMAA
jgi:hypothetical protein